MLVIRLARFGSKNQPTYRVIVSEKARDPFGNVLEYLGSYNPRGKEKLAQFKVERIKYWLSKGAKASPTLHNLLVTKGVITDKKVKAWTPRRKPVEAGKAASASAKASASAEATADKTEDKPAAVAKTEEAPKA